MAEEADLVLQELQGEVGVVGRLDVVEELGRIERAVDHGVRRLELATDHFVSLGDGDHLGDAGRCFELGKISANGIVGGSNIGIK